MLNVFLRACLLRVKAFRDSRKRYISGALGKAELAIRFDCGRLLAIPHWHFIWFAEDLAKDHVRDLLTDISETLFSPAFRRVGEWLKTEQLYPSIHCRRLSGPRALKTRLRYLVKPIDFVAPYEAAVVSGANINGVNEAFSAFLSDLPLAFCGNLNRVARFGVCSGNSPNYIGERLPTNHRKKRRLSMSQNHLLMPETAAQTEDEMFRELVDAAVTSGERSHFLSNHITWVEGQAVLAQDQRPAEIGGALEVPLKLSQATVLPVSAGNSVSHKLPVA